MPPHVANTHVPSYGYIQSITQHVSQALPAVNNPSFFQNYFENHPTSSTPTPSGYSPAHLQYHEERQCWATSAYKALPPQRVGQIPLRAQARQEVCVLLQPSYQLLSGKVEKVTVSCQHPFPQLLIP